MNKSFLVGCLFACSFSVVADELYSYESALLLYQQQDLENSFVHLRHVLISQPNNLAAKILLASILKQQGHFLDAVMLLEEVLDEQADVNLLLIDLIDCYLVTQKFDSLLKLNQYEGLSQDNKLYLLIASATAHQKLLNLDAATASLLEAEQISAKDPRVMNAKARLFITKGLISEASKLIDETIEKNPDNPQSWLIKGDIARALGKNISAIQAYQQANILDKKDPIIMRSLSSAYLAESDFKSAEKIIVQMNDLGLIDPYLKFAKVLIKQSQQQTAQASKELNDLHVELTALSPEYFDYHPEQLFLRASVGFLLKNEEQAVRDVENYLRLAPADVDAIALLTEYLYQNKDNLQTLKFLDTHEEAIQKSPLLLNKQIILNLELNKTQTAEVLVARAREKYPHDLDLILTNTEVIKQIHGPQRALEFINSQNLQNNPQFFALKTLLALDLNLFEQAIQSAEQLIELVPNSLEYLNIYAGALLKGGEIGKAQLQIDKILKSDKDHFSAKLTQANIWYIEGRFVEAEEILKSLDETKPNHNQTVTLLATVEIQLAKYKEAEKRLTAQLNKKYYRPAAELLIQHYINEKKYSDAQLLVGRSLRQYFMDKELMIKEAEILILQKEFKLASEKLEIIYQLPAINSDMFLKISKLQSEINDSISAEKSLEKAIDKFPNDLILNLEYANRLILNKKYKLAQEFIERMKINYPDDANVLILQAEVNVINGKFQTASDKFLQSLNLDPRFKRAWTGLYEIARDVNYSSTFEKKAIEVIESNPSDYWLIRLLAEHYVNHSKLSLAQELYLKLLESNQYAQDPYLLNNLANTYLQNDIEKSLYYSNLASSFLSNNVNILITHAKALSGLGQHEKALVPLRQAFTLDSQNFHIRYLTALSLFKLQRFDESKYILKGLVKEDPNQQFYDNVKELILEIDKLQ